MARGKALILSKRAIGERVEGRNAQATVRDYARAEAALACRPSAESAVSTM